LLNFCKFWIYTGIVALGPSAIGIFLNLK
jgi:hypothetical protein